MRPVLLFFVIAACSAAKLSHNQKAPSEASASGGGDFLSPSADQYGARRPSKHYLPSNQSDNSQHEALKYPHAIPDRSQSISYYIPPSEYQQVPLKYTPSSEIRQPSRDFLPPSDTINYQYEPHVDSKSNLEQYLLPLDSKQTKYTHDFQNNPNIIHHTANLPQYIPIKSNSEYSTHSPMDHAIPQYTINQPENVQSMYVLPTTNDIVSIFPQHQQIPDVQTNRRYDQQYVQQLDTKTYTSNQNTTQSPYYYQQNVQQTNFHQANNDNTVYQNYQSPTEVHIGKSNQNNWIKQEEQTTPQYVNQFAYNQANQVQNNIQPVQYGDKIYQQQQIQGVNSIDRSTTVSNSTQNLDKAETIIYPQQTKYVPQQPSQFKSTQQPIEVPKYQAYTQNQQNQYQQDFQQSLQNYYQNQYAKTVQNTTPYTPGPTTESMPVLKQIAEMAIDGSYNYETLIGDQTHIMQHGHIENPGTDFEEQVMQGSYSFVGDDGKTYTVNYIADKNGYRATGDHLPTPPPIPEIIQKSIEFNLAEDAARSTQQPAQVYQQYQADASRNYPAPVHERNVYESGYQY